MIQAAVHSILTTAPDLVALVSDRVYPLKLPQNPTLPALTYQVISSVPGYTHDGQDLTETRVQVSVWGLGALQTWQAADQVEKALSGYTGTVADVEIGACFQANRTDLFEDEVQQYHTPIDFLITHKEG